MTRAAAARVTQPILKDFEEETGIKVRAVYDTEEAKGTGVMNRLLSEKNNAQADVYWANEPIRAEVLKQEGVSAPYTSPSAEGIPDSFKDPETYWTGFAARARFRGPWLGRRSAAVDLRLYGCHLERARRHRQSPVRYDDDRNGRPGLTLGSGQPHELSKPAAGKHNGDVHKQWGERRSRGAGCLRL